MCTIIILTSRVCLINLFEICRVFFVYIGNIISGGLWFFSCDGHSKQRCQEFKIYVNTIICSGVAVVPVLKARIRSILSH